MHPERIKRLIKNLPYQCQLVTDTPDIFYLTGVKLDGLWLLVSRKGPVIFAPRLLADHAQSLLPGIPVIKGDKVIDLLKDYCKKSRARTIGVDSSRISYLLGQRLSKFVKLKDASGAVATLRANKDPGEIEKIKKACKITANALRSVRPFIRPGVREEDIAVRIEEYFLKNKAKPAFSLIVGSGPNGANPHHLSSFRKLREGDLVVIDIGCEYEGYCSDLTRTVLLGKMNDLKKRIYDLVQAAQNAAVRAVKGGAKACDVDAAARGVIARAGYGERFIHTTGHGVGIEVHEAPRVSATDPTVLRAGMVVTIEPGIYLPKQFGVRIEDTLLVTPEGSEVLTQ